MPAPYPRREPLRTMQSKLGRGAPRGTGQARGLSGVRGDQFVSGPSGSPLTWVYDVDNVWEGVNSDAQLIPAGTGLDLILFEESLAADFVTVSGGSPEATQTGLYQIELHGSVAVADVAAVTFQYNAGTMIEHTIDSPAMTPIAPGFRNFGQTFTVPLPGDGFGAFSLFAGSEDSDVELVAGGSIDIKIYQVIRGG